MAEEPTLPALPKVAWDSHALTFSNTRKRHRDGVTAPILFSNSSDPAVFSSDDDPHIDNYVNGRHRKKRYVGSWFQQMPASSDSTFSEVGRLLPKPKRAFERHFDSGVWMGSDGSVDPDEDFALDVEPSPEPKLPQLRNPRPVPSVAPEELIVRARVDAAIEEGNPDIDLSSLGVNTVSNRSISRLAELVLIPSVDKDVPFEQTNPELGLYLSNNRLARAPSALFNLEHLTYLSLRNNQILELPPSIGKLRNLRELNISLNRLRYLPGELLSLLKFPSALSSLHIHPNPFHRPEGCLPLPPRPMPEGGVYSESHGDVFIPSRHLPMFPSDNVTMFVTQDDRSAEEICRQFHLLAGKDDGQYAETAGAWHVALLTRSQVQYSDSCGSVLSKFRLPCEQSEDVQSRGFGEGQQVTLQTEDPSVFSVPCLTGRLPDDPSQPSHVLTLFELALKSASRAAQTWDLASCLPPQAPSSVLRSIDRIMAQTAFNGNSGTLPCSICGRQVTTPTAQWIEWWDISKWEHRPRPGGSQGHEWAPEPLSINPNEYAIPFLKRGCSWNCTPRPMKIGQCMPGTLQFQWA